MIYVYILATQQAELQAAYESDLVRELKQAAASQKHRGRGATEAETGAEVVAWGADDASSSEQSRSSGGSGSRSSENAEAKRRSLRPDFYCAAGNLSLSLL